MNQPQTENKANDSITTNKQSENTLLCASNNPPKNDVINFSDNNIKSIIVIDKK